MIYMYFFFCRHCTYDNDINPYIHVFVYHVPYIITKYGSIEPFAMQAVEQLNYQIRQIYFGGTNHG